MSSKQCCSAKCLETSFSAYEKSGTGRSLIAILSTERQKKKKAKNCPHFSEKAEGNSVIDISTVTAGWPAHNKVNNY